MKTIHVNVTGTPTDVPVLIVDGGLIYLAELSAGRATFGLNDTEPTGTGASIVFDGRSIRVLVPPPGAWEADQAPVKPPEATTPIALAYTPRVARLTAADDALVDGAGRRVVLGLASEFRIWQMVLRGEDTTAIRAERRAAGAQGSRVFGTCKNLFDLDPRRYRTYYDDLPRFAQLLAADGEYLQFTAITDAQLLPGLDLVDHWERCCEALAPEPNVVICELVNEYFKNGVDPWRFRRPPVAPPVVSVGSFIDGDYPPAPWGDVATFHPTRSWKWWFTVAATAQEIRQDPRGRGKPVWIGEPMGAAATPRGDRASDPARFEQLGVSIGVYAAGGVYHSDGGRLALPWSDAEFACAAAFFRGIHR